MEGEDTKQNITFCPDIKESKIKREKYPEWDEISDRIVEDNSSEGFKLEVKQERENLEIESYYYESELIHHKIEIDDESEVKMEDIERQYMACNEPDSEESRDILDIENKSVPEEDINCELSKVVARHSKIESNRHKFRCKYCSKTFINSSTVKIHERIHTKENPHTCNLSPKAFSAKSVLADHLITHSATEKSHTQENLHSCQHCGKSFAAKSKLANHELIHTGERHYKCNICSKTFTLKGTLMRHERKHTGEKPFRCKVCSKEFSQSGILKRHEVIHTGLKAYKCEVCLKTYSRREALLVHNITHMKDSWKLQQATSDKGAVKNSEIRKIEMP